MLRTTIYFILILIVIVCGSAVSAHFWAGEKEQLPESITGPVSEEMTVAAFGMSDEQLSKKVNAALAIQAEHASKNWFKISLKGILWLIFLSTVFTLMRTGQISVRSRKWIYMAAVGGFGILLGSDASASAR